MKLINLILINSIWQAIIINVYISKLFLLSKVVLVGLHAPMIWNAQTLSEEKSVNILWLHYLFTKGKVKEWMEISPALLCLAVSQQKQAPLLLKNLLNLISEPRRLKLRNSPSDDELNNPLTTSEKRCGPGQNTELKVKSSEHVWTAPQPSEHRGPAWRNRNMAEWINVTQSSYWIFARVASQIGDTEKLQHATNLIRRFHFSTRRQILSDCLQNDLSFHIK